MSKYRDLLLFVIMGIFTIPIWCGNAFGNNAALTSTLSLLLFGDKVDCYGDNGGTAYLDNCNVCVGGNSGKKGCRYLNDSGIIWSGGYPDGNNDTCISEVWSTRDCEQGRDATHNNDSDGHAGFSFVKLDSSGNLLPADAAIWSCVKDNVTGLVWEVKTDDDGLQDKDDLYNWYSTDSTANGGWYSSMNDDQDVCYGYDENDSESFCNTEAYVDRINNATLCGKSDWRMPTPQELTGIVSYDRVNPTIDLTYFPNTLNTYFWTGAPSVQHVWAAWYVYFSSGSSSTSGRRYLNAVRLVRNE